MSDITSEELNELDKLACEQHKLNRLIAYIEDPSYIVMYVNKDIYFPLADKIHSKDDELQVYFKNLRDKYVDLFNIVVEEDVKIFKEIIFE